MRYGQSNSARNLELYGFPKQPELRKIVRYIQRTDGDCTRKSMMADELKTLFLFSQKGCVCHAIILSYFFGQAKGFRTCQEKGKKT